MYYSYSPLIDLKIDNTSNKNKTLRLGLYLDINDNNLHDSTKLIVLLWTNQQGTMRYRFYSSRHLYLWLCHTDLSLFNSIKKYENRGLIENNVFVAIKILFTVWLTCFYRPLFLIGHKWIRYVACSNFEFKYINTAAEQQLVTI